MKYFKTVIAALLLGSITAFAAGKLQNSNFATSADITGAGGTIAQLLNTSKIYDSTNAQLLDTTIAAKLNSSAFTDTAVTSKLITGYTSGAGVVAATDTILQAIQKLNGNIAAIVPGSGDVVGPASSVDSEIALFDSTTGKLLKRATGTGVCKSTSGVFSVGSVDLTSEITGVLPLANGGTNKNMTAVNGGVVWTDADSMEVIAAGTSGQILQSNGAAAPSWVAAPVNSPLTTKGDVYTYDTANARLPVGTNGQVLSADSAEATGLKWITPASGGDLSSSVGTSVDGEVVVFDSTTGKLVKRATGSGYAKLTSGVLSAQSTPIPSADVNGGRTVNAQTGTTYTFALSDGSAAGGFPLVTASNASAQTYTVPPNSSVAFPIGTQIDVTQLGAGLVTFAQGAGVTINSVSGSFAMLGQYSEAFLTKTGTDTWVLSGNPTAPASSTSEVLVSGGNGFGSTNTTIRRFTNIVSSSGSAITYADSATLGNSFTINNAGVYCIQYNDSKSSGTANHGLSVNSTQLTTSINSITNANLLMQISVDGSLGVQGVVSYCGIFAVNDVIRAHTDGTQNTAGNPVVRLKITRIGN